jgi:hypothetical protein
MYGTSCPRCIPNTLVLYQVYQVQTVPINSKQLQLIATDTPNTFNIASPPDSNEASSLTFCKHPHYLIRLMCFELYVPITLPPLSRQWIEIIPYIKRFLKWIETHSLGVKLQSQNVLHIRLYEGASFFSGPTSQSTGGSSVFIDFGHCLQWPTHTHTI